HQLLFTSTLKHINSIHINSHTHTHTSTLFTSTLFTHTHTHTHTTTLFTSTLFTHTHTHTNGRHLFEDADASPGPERPIGSHTLPLSQLLLPRKPGDTHLHRCATDSVLRELVVTVLSFK